MKYPTRVEQEAMAEAYDGGLSLEKVGLRFGRSIPVVHAACEACGVPVRAGGQRKGPDDPKRLARLIEMRANGATLDEMAAEYKVTRERVRQVLTKAGVDTSIENRPLRPEQLALVEEYVREGGNLSLYAKRGAVGDETFKNWVTKAGHKLRPPGGGSRRPLDLVERDKKAVKLYLETRMTVPEIAKACGYNHSTGVYRALARELVKLRDKPIRHNNGRTKR